MIASKTVINLNATRPPLPATTPTPPTLGNHPNVYYPLNPSPIKEIQTSTLNNGGPSQSNDGTKSYMRKKLTLQEREATKIISKLPFPVRESVSSIVNMLLGMTESLQNELELSVKELKLLKSEYGKKNNELHTLQLNCEVYRERLSLFEDNVESLKDNLEYTQKNTIKNRSAMSRLSATNRMLIDSLDALEFNSKKKMLKQVGSNSAPLLSVSKSGNQPPSNILILPEETQGFSFDGDDHVNNIMQRQGRNPRVLSPLNGTRTKTPERVTARGEMLNIEAEAKYSQFQNDKLRESLLRVAREHYRSMKNSEILEEKVTELRSKLRIAENQSRKLKSELDEIRSQQYSSAEHAENTLLGDNSAPRTPKRKEFGYIDNRLTTLLDRNGFDPVEGILQLRRILAHSSTAPNNLDQTDIISHFVSRDATRIFDCSIICLFLIKPGNSNMLMKYTVRSSHPVMINISEKPSLVAEVVKTGKVERVNTLSHCQHLNVEVDSSHGIITKRILALPLFDNESKTVMGALHIINKGTNNEVFSEIDELFAMIYADQTSLQLCSCRQYDKIAYRSSMLQSLLESSTALFSAIPEPNSLALAKKLSPGQILTTLEMISLETLRCSDSKAFLLSEYLGMEAGSLVMLEHKLHQPSLPRQDLIHSIRTASLNSGIAGYVIKTRCIYYVEDPAYDTYVNPLTDLDPLSRIMVAVPIMDLYGTVVGCIELVLGPNSPNLRPTTDGRDNKILFSQAAQWFAHQIATPLQYLINFIGRPVDRPMSTPQSISLSLFPRESNEKQRSGGAFFPVMEDGLVSSNTLQSEIQKPPAGMQAYYARLNRNDAHSRSSDLTDLIHSANSPTNSGNKKDFVSIPFSTIKFDANNVQKIESEPPLMPANNNNADAPPSSDLQNEIPSTIPMEQLINQDNYVPKHEFEGLQSKLIDMTQSSEELKNELESVQLRLQQQMEDTNQFEFQVNSLRHELQKITSEWSAEKLAMKTAHDEEMSRFHAMMKEEFTSLQLEMDKLRQDNHSKKNQSSEEEHLMVHLHSVISNLKVELIETQSEVSPLRDQLLQKDHAMKTLSQDNVELRQMVERLKATLAAALEAKPIVNHQVAVEESARVAHDHEGSSRSSHRSSSSQNEVVAVEEMPTVRTEAEEIKDEVNQISDKASSMESSNPHAEPILPSLDPEIPNETLLIESNTTAPNHDELRNVEVSVNSIERIETPQEIDVSKPTTTEPLSSKPVVEQGVSVSTSKPIDPIISSERRNSSEKIGPPKDPHPSSSNSVPSTRASTRGQSRMRSEEDNNEGMNDTKDEFGPQDYDIDESNERNTQQEMVEYPLPEGWNEDYDNEGKKYYFNQISGESTWFHPNSAEYINSVSRINESVEGEDDAPTANESVVPPPPLMQYGDWLQSFDENGNEYWLNVITGESSWELPGSYMGNNEDAAVNENDAVEGEYTIEL